MALHYVRTAPPLVSSPIFWCIQMDQSTLPACPTLGSWSIPKTYMHRPLDGDSHHCPVGRRAVLSSSVCWAFSFSDTQGLHNEIVHLKKTFLQNAYREREVALGLHGTWRKLLSLKGWHLLYAMAQSLQRLDVYKVGIKAIYHPPSKISQLLGSVKDNEDEGIYSSKALFLIPVLILPCSDSDWRPVNSFELLHLESLKSYLIILLLLNKADQFSLDLLNFIPLCANYNFWSKSLIES